MPPSQENQSTILHMAMSSPPAYENINADDQRAYEETQQQRSGAKFAAMDDDSDESDLEDELLAVHMNGAAKDMTAQKFDLAEKRLHKAYSILVSDSRRKKRKDTLIDISSPSDRPEDVNVLFKILACQEAQGKWQAVADTSSVLSALPLDQAHSLQVQYHLARALKNTNKGMEDLQKAQACCENAMKGQRKLLGKRHPEYIRTMSLLADILEASGDELDAEAYRAIVQKAGPLPTEMITKPEVGPPKRAHDQVTNWQRQFLPRFGFATDGKTIWNTSTDTSSHVTNLRQLFWFATFAAKSDVDDTHLMRLCINAGVSVQAVTPFEQIWLWNAVNNSSITVLAKLFAGRSNFSLRTPAESVVGYSGQRHHSPMSMAISLGRLDVVQLLAQLGYSMQEKDAYGWTPAFIAARYAKLDILLWIHSKNFNDLHERDATGWTIMHVACRFADGNSAVVEYLAKTKTLVNMATTRLKYVPLHVATQNRQYQAAQVLLENGAFPDAVELEKGQTALHMAAAANRPYAVIMLLAHGAQTGILDSKRLTPYGQAKKENCPECQRILEMNGSRT